MRSLAQLQSRRNPLLRESLKVPDEKRSIFTDGKATLAQLSSLRVELDGLLRDVEQGLVRSFKRLSEARIKYPF